MWSRSRPAVGLAAGLAVGAVLVASAGACGPRRAGQGAAVEPAVVVFSNESLYEAAVYVVPRGGAQIRVGTVQPGRTDTLRVRGAALAGSGAVSIVARLLAVSRTPTTGSFTLFPGDHVVVRLPPDAYSLSVLPAP